MNIEKSIEILKNILSQRQIGLAEVTETFYEAIETLLTAYEKEKEKNSKAIGHIEACKTSLGNYILSPNETEYLLEILKEE